MEVVMETRITDRPDDGLDPDLDQYHVTFQNVSNSTFAHPFSVLVYRAIFIVIYIVIFIVCIIGNALVLLVTSKSVHMKTRTYFFLANLAVADLCIGLLCVLPKLLTFIYPGWVLGQALCKIYHFTESFSFCASIMLLAVIAIERYIAVLHPLKAKGLFTKWRMHALQVTIWAVAAIYNSPLFINFDTITIPGAVGSEPLEFCFVMYVIDMRTYYTLNFVLWYAVPLLLMLFVYIVIAWTLWNSGSVLKASTTNNTGSGHRLLPSVAHAQKDKLERGQSVRSSYGCVSEGRMDDRRCSQGKPFAKERRESSMCPEKCVHTKATLCCGPFAPKKDPTAYCGQKASRMESMTNDVDKNVDSEEIGHANFSTSSDNVTLADSPTSKPLSVCKNKDGVSVCWSWGSKYDTPREDNTKSRVSKAKTEPPNVTQPLNFSEQTSLHCHKGDHRHSVQGSTSLCQGPPHVQASGSRNSRQIAINFDAHSDTTYNSVAPSKTSGLDSKTRISTTSRRVLSSRRKVVRLLVILLSAFAICVLPHHVRLLMHFWDVYPTSNFAIGFLPPLTFLCLYLNSALNPVLYGLFSDSFRRSLREYSRKPWQRCKSFISKPDELNLRRGSAK